MTREEAIEIINRENDPNDKKVWELFPEYREALDMAIKALELDYKTAFQIACALLNGDILYGTDAESIFSEIMKKDGCVCSFDYENYILTHLNGLRDDKTLSQEPCEKCEVGNPCLYCEHKFSQKIEPMRDFNKKEAEAYSKALDRMYKPTGLNVFKEPCEDAISREDVIAEMEELNAVSFYEANEHSKEAYYEIKNMIKTMPSVTQKSKTGHWIETEYHHWRCSVCREKGMSEWDNIHNVRTNFCPNCGARMVEPQESEEQTE